MAFVKPDSLSQDQLIPWWIYEKLITKGMAPKREKPLSLNTNEEIWWAIYEALDGFIAGSGSYTPSTPSNWSPVPTTYSGGLDQLADKVKIEYNSASGVVNMSLTGNSFLTMDTTLGAGTVNLPPSAGTGLFFYIIKDLGNASVNNITINAAGGDYIDTPGSFSRVINTNSGFIALFNIGIGWMVWSKG